MADGTDRLRLPLLTAGQAQKEVTHNEALLLLDLLVQASVQSAGLTSPPPPQHHNWGNAGWLGEGPSARGRGRMMRWRAGRQRAGALCLPWRD